MKKALCALCLTVWIFVSVFPCMASDINIYINGESQQFEPAAFISENRTMVPMRAIFEKLGAELFWDDIKKEVTAKRNGNEIKLAIGDTLAHLNASQIILDAPAVIVNSRTMVPLRFVSESLGANVAWDAETRTVSINDVPVSYAVTSVTASADDGNKPENVIDGDYNTRWSAQGIYCTLTLELSENLPIGYVGVAWYIGNERNSNFEIELSENGTNFYSVFKGQSPLTLNMTGYDAGGKNAKFIRIACMGNSENLWNSITEIKIYPPLEGGKIIVENAALDGASASELSSELAEALSVIDKSYDAALLDYIAGMYDVERGMFYFSASARDNEGFMADIESTSQAVNILKYLGIWNTSYMPEDFIPKMVKSIRECQSDEDGYFYDIQFGSDVSQSKRERNNSQALSIIAMGGEPLFKTAAERMRDEMTQNKASALSSDSIFASEQSYTKWLYALFEEHDAYYAGNIISSSWSTIKSAGYDSLTRDYVSSLQNPENGLWGENSDYAALNAAMKCATVYEPGHPFPNIEKAIDSSLYVIKNCSTQTTAMVWNPFALFSKMISSYGNNIDKSLAQKFNSALAEAYTHAAAELADYRQPDSGYSWLKTGSSIKSQEAIVSLGLAEGDMNGTALAVYLRNNTYNLAGVKSSDYPIFTDNEIRDFWDKIKSSKPIQKKVKPIGFKSDFSNIKTGGIPEYCTSSAENGFIGVLEKAPDRIKNSVLRIYSEGKNSVRFASSCSSPDSYSTLSLQFDIYIDPNCVGNLFYNTLGNSSTAVSWCISASNGLANISVRESDEGLGSSLGTMSLGEWYTLRIDYTPKNGKSVLYIDSSPKGSSLSYYGKSDGKTPVTKIDGFSFATFKSAKADVYIDNISLSFN